MNSSNEEMASTTSPPAPQPPLPAPPSAPPAPELTGPPLHQHLMAMNGNGHPHGLIDNGNGNGNGHGGNVGGEYGTYPSSLSSGAFNALPPHTHPHAHQQQQHHHQQQHQQHHSQHQLQQPQHMHPAHMSSVPPPSSHPAPHHHAQLPAGPLPPPPHSTLPAHHVPPAPHLHSHYDAPTSDPLLQQWTPAHPAPHLPPPHHDPRLYEFTQGPANAAYMAAAATAAAAAAAAAENAHRQAFASDASSLHMPLVTAPAADTMDVPPLIGAENACPPTNGEAQKRRNELEADDNETPEMKKLLGAAGVANAAAGASSDEKKIVNLRRNIRDVMDEHQLDTNTLAAQREESERLARVAEQQKIIREYQRQTAVNRQNARTQNRFLSLLQSGKTFAKPLADPSLEKSTAVTSSTTLAGVEPASTILDASEGDSSSGHASATTLSMVTAAALPPASGELLPSSLGIGVSSPKSDSNAYLDMPEEPQSIEDSPASGASDEKQLPSGDVVTIEDSSSEDDCILLSDDEDDLDEDEDEAEDDPHNSGLHVKDAYNVPDEHGRVVVNIGHPEGEEDIFVAPQIAKTIKPHQIGGVRFLFDNIVESTRRFKSSSGFGCILSHSMGLGKTLQVICFCDIFLRHTDSKTVLCVMPINTLQNWVSEFNMWLPRHTPAGVDADEANVRLRQFDVYVLNDQQKTLTARAKIILKWADEGGVLLIGYELFRLLALKLMTTRRRRTNKNPDGFGGASESNKRLMDSVHQALVRPGPDLVICDEGHRIKNAHAGISVALKQIRTRRRIVLTGYPLQNNLLEYWCMVDFVRPNYLGNRTEFCNMFERPIQNGQCIDSTPEDIKLMRYRAHVLHSLLVGFVQRRSHVVLQQTLPQKLEYVVLTRMTAFQRQLYEKFMNDVVRTKTVPNPLRAFAVCCKIWNHPDVLYNFLKKHETDLDLDEVDEADAVAPVDLAPPPIVAGDAGLPLMGSVAPPDVSSSSNTTTTSAAESPGTTTTDADVKTEPTDASLEAVATQIDTATSVNAEPVMSPAAAVVSTSKSTVADVKPIDAQVASVAGHAEPNMNKSYESMYYPGNYYQQQQQQSQPQQQQQQQRQQHETQQPRAQQPQQSHQQQQDAMSAAYTSSSDCNGNNYWQEPSVPYFVYPQVPSNMGYAATKPDYVGIMVKQSKEEQATSEGGVGELVTSSSEIVDLDTKEIKTVETNIDMVIKKDPDALSSTAVVTAAGAEDAGGAAAAGDEGIIDLDAIKGEVNGIDDSDEKSISGVETNSSSAQDQLKLSPSSSSLAIIGGDVSRNPDRQLHEWAFDLMRRYEPGLIRNSPKMELFFTILNESIQLDDRVLLFSQSLLTLNLIEEFLQANCVLGTDVRWARNSSYFRLDGSTTSQEREKLVNEFNANTNVKLFLISTRAGSLGINLVGANRVIVFDASWNPCHDTQAVYRIYRYGQHKPCFVYRIVMDKCLEKKIYDRQIKKQGMSDRVVDECNPDAHLSLKDVTNLCHDYDDDDAEKQKAEAETFTQPLDSYKDTIVQKIVAQFKHCLSKEPFYHDSLLIDRKEKKLSQAEKRQAHRGYEMEKKASIRQGVACTPNNKLQYRIVNKDGTVVTRPMLTPTKNAAMTKAGGGGGQRSMRWIPAEVWQRQGMSAQEMTLPLDVVIPTNSSDKSNIILKAGQRVMVLKSVKGIYMQLESGKIIAIRTSSKTSDAAKTDKEEVIDITAEGDGMFEGKGGAATTATGKPQTPTKSGATGIKSECIDVDVKSSPKDALSLAHNNNANDVKPPPPPIKHDCVDLKPNPYALLHKKSNSPGGYATLGGVPGALASRQLKHEDKGLGGIVGGAFKHMKSPSSSTSSTTSSSSSTTTFKSPADESSVLTASSPTSATAAHFMAKYNAAGAVSAATAGEQSSLLKHTAPLHGYGSERSSNASNHHSMSTQQHQQHQHPHHHHHPQPQHHHLDKDALKKTMEYASNHHHHHHSMKSHHHPYTSSSRTPTKLPTGASDSLKSSPKPEKHTTTAHNQQHSTQQQQPHHHQQQQPHQQKMSRSHHAHGHAHQQHAHHAPSSRASSAVVGAGGSYYGAGSAASSSSAAELSKYASPTSAAASAQQKNERGASDYAHQTQQHDSTRLPEPPQPVSHYSTLLQHQQQQHQQQQQQSQQAPQSQSSQSSAHHSKQHIYKPQLNVPQSHQSSASAASAAAAQYNNSTTGSAAAAAAHLNVPQSIAAAAAAAESNLATNAFFGSRNAASADSYASSHHYADAAAAAASYDYAAAQFSDYPVAAAAAYGAYATHPYHSYFHSNAYGGGGAGGGAVGAGGGAAMGANPYMHWSPLVTPASLGGEQSSAPMYHQHAHQQQYTGGGSNGAVGGGGGAGGGGGSATQPNEWHHQ